MKINSVLKGVASLAMAGAFVFSFSMMVSAANLDTEIPSSGITIALDNYYDKCEDPEVEILALISTCVTSTAEENAYFNTIAIAQVDSYVNVRKKPDADSKIVGKIYGNCGATIVGFDGDWYKIQSGNVEGYIKSEYFITGEEAQQYALDNGYVLATVNGSGLRVRKKPSLKSKVVSAIYVGATYAVTAYSEDDNWIKLAIEDGVKGWVSTDYIDVEIILETAMTLKEEKAMLKAQAEQESREAESESLSIAESQEASRQQELAAAQQTVTYSYNNYTTQQTTTQASTTASTYDSSSDSNADLRSQVVAYAKQFLGNPYVYGGSSLTNGTDCSGFTMSVYAHFGYYLNRSSASQASNGTSVSMDSLLPGDLLFYTNGTGSIKHVAMYIGGGQIIHASTESTGICISNAFYNTPCCARRIIN
ncbi:MAG: NlpC/P60 family protein [Eubacterium sp.]